jgi:hypothetical protein
MNQRAFRCVVVLSLALGLVGALTDMLFPSLLPTQIHEAQTAQDDAMSVGQLAVALCVGLPGVVLLLSATYGLFCFRAWAPRAALIGTAIALVSLPALGATGQSGLSQALSYAAAYAWGARLVISHVEPYRAWFTRPA